MTNPDDVSAVREAAVSRLGDVWTLGPHRLVVGDSTDPQVIRNALDGAMADLLLTDPPYNVGYVGKTADALTIENDATDEETFRAFLTSALQAAFENVGAGCPAYVFHAPGPLSAVAAQAFSAAGWSHRQNLIWRKNSLVLSRYDYHYIHEPIMYGWKPGDSHRWYADRKQVSVLDFDRPTKSVDHPTMKPVDLIAYLIGNSSKIGDLVLDPFGGSGSTLIACHTTGRRCATVELDPHYADVIARRYADHTGEPVYRNGELHVFD